MALTKNKSYWNYLTELWGLDNGKDTWVWWLPPICIIGLPLGILVTLIFTKDFIISKRKRCPLPKRWNKINGL